MTILTTFHHQIPSEIIINRNWSCRPSEPENEWKKPYLVEPTTVESIKAALDIAGPFAAIAALGPRRYTAEPIQFNNHVLGHLDVPVYGWKTGAQQTDSIFKQSIIICGVQRNAEQEHIYYVLADDVSEDPQMAIGKYRTSTDKRIFVSSLKRFNENESDMFPPVSEDEINKYRSQRVVPTPLAGRPDLIQAWEKGEIRCEWKDEKWHVSKPKPTQKPQVFITTLNN